LQFDVIADLSGIIGESKARLNFLSNQEIEQTFDKMLAITTRFLVAVNYRGNPALPLFPRYPPVVPTRGRRPRRSHPTQCALRCILP
jgi:hypothetical protein